MRIIAGTARRLPLKTLEGNHTRPTTDRIKETLFNMLQFDIPGCNFLDLFAGSGQIGLEALSRGAASAVFVDNNKKACACIEENIRFTHFEKKSRLLSMEALPALRSMEGKYTFDYIYMDPPYGQEYEKNVIAYLANSELLKPETTLIVEASLDTDFSYAADLGFQILKEKKYKTNQHVFLTKQKRP